MDLRGFSVLIVEDEPSLMALAEAALLAAGCSVVVCSNGLEALDLCHDQGLPFDAILMDVKMPVMDGLEATRRLRAHARTHRTPIIIVSALAWPSDHEEGMRAGADAYVTKPYDFKGLLALLDSFRAKVS